MKQKYLTLAIISLFALFLGYYIISTKTPLPFFQQPYNLGVNLQYCNYSYGLEGNKFGATAEIINTGKTINPPGSIWLFYDNKICDKKDVDKPHEKKSVLFSSHDEGWFGCDVELPPGRRDAEKMDKNFEFIFTVKNQDPLKEGVKIFSASTKDLCFTVVQ